MKTENISILEGLQQRTDFPDQCPVCDTHIDDYSGIFGRIDRKWTHEIKYKCGCELIINCLRMQVVTPCPESHELAIQFKKELKKETK